MDGRVEMLAGPSKRALVLVAVAVALAACDDSTRLEVVICGNVSVPARNSPICQATVVTADAGTLDAGPVQDFSDISAVAVEATADNGDVVYRATADLCEWRLPFTATIRNGWDYLTVNVTAWGGGGRIEGITRPRFPAAGVNEIHMGLTTDCLNVNCPPERTCVDGNCEAITEGYGSRICR